MVAPRKYPDELRERAIRLVLDAKADPASNIGACVQIGGQLGITRKPCAGAPGRGRRRHPTGHDHRSRGANPDPSCSQVCHRRPCCAVQKPSIAGP
jgi:hypothetical protein